MTAHAQPWQAFMQDMAQLEQELLAIAPDCELAHAEAQRYLARLLRYAIGRHIDRTGSPARPVISQETARIGGDNPDYRYGTADLDGRLRYRVAGRLNDAYRLGIGTYAGGLGTAQGLRGTGYVNVDARMVDDSGNFELVLSTETVPGHWLPMATGTNSLIIRQLVLDPQAHRPAEIAIECLSGADRVEPRPVRGDELLDRMAHARQFLAGTVRQFIGWSASFARFPNAVRPLDPALLGAAQETPARVTSTATTACSRARRWWSNSRRRPATTGTCRPATTGWSHWTSCGNRHTSTTTRRRPMRTAGCAP